MNFDEKIQLKVLQLKAGMFDGKLIDHLIEGSDTPALRQMCAKITPQLHDRLDQMTSLLDMSKREFVEAALIEALNKAEEVLERSGAIRQLTGEA